MAKPPSVRFLLAHPAHFFALGCGSGLAPKAPGTFGTLFAWATFALFHHHFSDFGLLFLLTVAYLGGIWFILLMTPDTFLWQLAAFALFRYFDITKPQPARYFDQHVKNGFGVMADDLVAAGYTLLCLALLKIVFA